MKKRLSQREKLMMVFLVVVVLAVLWFKLVYEPIDNQIAELNTTMANEQTELETGMIKVAEMNKMEKFLKEEKENGVGEAIPFFDNSKNLMVLLNGILSSATECSIDFKEPETEGYLVSRQVEIEFLTDTYYQARAIIDRLNNDTYTNQISDLSIDIDMEKTKSKAVDTNLTITFFEITK